jgi:replicative DNA helicase
MTETIARTTGLTPEGLTPPQAIEAERAVLAALLLDHESIGLAVEMIDTTAFYRTAHQKMFDAIVALYERNEKADAVTLAEELRKRGDLEAVGGLAALSQILEYATASANLPQHIRIIHAKSILRMLIHATGEIQQEAYAGQDDAATILDRAEQRIFAVTDQRVRQGFISMKDLMMPTMKHIEELSERKLLVTGVSSGFDDLDKVTSGFQKSDLVIIAGRPSMGKTSFALNIAENAAIRHNVPVGVFSLEMSKEQLALRLICSQAEVPMFKVRSGHLSSAEWGRLVNLTGHLYKAPIMIDDSAAPSVLEIRAKCRRLRTEGKLQLVIVDYLQLIRATGTAENRVQEIGQVTRGLKALAKELDVPVIALSQLSRAVETRGGMFRPQLSDLRESGSIEQDADVVMFVYRGERYKPDDPALQGKAEIIVAKQRNGPTDEVTLTFRSELMKFLPYTPVPEHENPGGF